jgi:glycosyltransferase involved in cell wall biosynthesis
MQRIAHISSVHHVMDTRIRLKQCSSLASAGYEVVLIGRESPLPAPVDGVSVRLVPNPRSRIARALRTGSRAFQLARALRPHVYQFHDPELIPFALLAKLLGGRVIYDAHEDLPLQVLTKDWIPSLIRPVASRMASTFLPVALRRLDGVIAATPAIRQSIKTANCEVIQNFPLARELVTDSSSSYLSRQHVGIYVGGVTAERGARQMVQALEYIDTQLEFRLDIVGEVKPRDLKDRLKSQPGGSHVRFLGWQDRDGLRSLLNDARIGLVVFSPIAHHLEAQPTKLFEYMSAGLPVVASDFPLWREIVRGVGCGLVVDPMDPPSIARAISWLLQHPNEAEEMGQRGLSAVRSVFNWEKESEKLTALYKRVLS